MRELISLGQRCDVAFQLRCHSGRNVAHFFDWLVSPLASVVRAFDEDFDVFAPDQLEIRDAEGHRYLHDAEYGFTFHHQFPMVGPNVSTDYLLFYPAFAAKFRHLADRFRVYCRERPVTFVRRNVDKHGAEQIEEAFFKRFSGANAEFLYIIHTLQPFETNSGKSVAMEPPSSGLGDMVAWANLLVGEGLVDTPFRLSTEEVLGRDEDDHALAGAERFSEDQLKAALETNPINDLFRLELSRVYARRGRWNDAVEALASATSQPPVLDILIEHAVARWRAGAISASTAVIEARVPTCVKAASLRSKIDYIDLLMAAADYQTALKLSQETLDANAVVHSLYFRKAVCLTRLGRQKSALSAIAAAIHLATGIPAYHQIKAGILVKLKRLPDAIAAQSDVTRLGGGYNAYAALGNLLARAGRKSEAIEAFRSAETIRPDKSELVSQLIRSLEPGEGG